jgi:hypothetical protein
MVGTSAKAFMAALNLPDPDVLIKWGQKTYGFVPWAWKFVTRQETRASRKLSTRLDLLVDNIWPFLSTGSPRIDSLRCVLEELFRLSEGEDQKIKSQILNRYRILGEWLSCRYIQIRHTLLKRPTPIALTDYFVELNMILGGIEKVLAEFSLGISSLANCPQELRQNYLKFRDTYNHFLTGYEALCRDAKATFREIPEASFKRIE